MDDSYQKEFDAEVVSVKDDKYVVLSQTAFYPQGGGLPPDTGKIIRDGEEFNVVFVGKFDGQISHEVDKPGLKIGDKVHGIIDWDKRYGVMRHHTAAHIVSAVLHRESGALITGNQVSWDGLRVDFGLQDFDREKLQSYVDLANAEIEKGQDVSVSYMDREVALENPGMVKLAGAMPPNVETLRIVKIGDVDLQADGGTHVNNTKEIGKLIVDKLENKGSGRKRIYIKTQ